MTIENGTEFRALINNAKVISEVRTSFEPEDIRITLFISRGDDTYNKWLKRKGERVNFKLTNTNIDMNVIIKNVILIASHDEPVEVLLKLQQA